MNGMTWLEEAQYWYQKYINSQISEKMWMEVCADLLENLLEKNEDVLDRLKNV